MNRREVAALACKVIALCMFMLALWAGSGLLLLPISGVLALFGGEAHRFYTAVFIGVPTLSYLAGGLVLWFGADRIAARMTSDDPAPVTREDVTAESVLGIALVVVGLLVGIRALRGLAMSILVVSGYGGVREAPGPRWHAGLWSSVLGVVIGLVLIFGRRGLVKLFRWARARTSDEHEGTST
jgi:hypothetical protein